MKHSYSPEGLRAEWHEYLDALSALSLKKKKIDLYIYFLHAKKNFTFMQIAELLESYYTDEKVTRQRIGQIIAKVRSSISKGGVK